MSVGVIDLKCYTPTGPSQELSPRGESPNANAIIEFTSAGEGTSEGHGESDVWKPSTGAGNAE